MATNQHLYDYDSGQDLGLATPAQVQASEKAANTDGGAGVILVNSEGTVISDGSWDAQQPGVVTAWTGP